MARPSRTAVRDRCRWPRPVVSWAEFLAAVSLAAAGGQTAFRELPRCPGYVGGHDIGGVPVQAGTRPVVAHRGARVGV